MLTLLHEQRRIYIKEKECYMAPPIVIDDADILLERDMEDTRRPRTIWKELINALRERNPGTNFVFIPEEFAIIENPGLTKKKKVLVSILAIPT